MTKRLEDIGKKLDVSPSTVSRALDRRTQHMVKEDTRKRIFDLIKKAGFKPNIKARNLARGRLTNFSIILPTGIDSIFYDEYYLSIIKGVNSALLGTDYSLSILPIEKNYSPDEIYRILLNHETAGLILSPYCKYIEFPFDLMKRYGLPIVIIDNEIKEKNCYSIMLDHKTAGRLGAEILWKKGHRNIVLISDIGHSQHSEMRKDGFYEFFKDKPGNIYTITNLEYKFSYVSGAPALDDIIKINKFPTAVFSLNDEIALGIMNNLKNKAVSCPKDISMLGFDGLSAGQYTTPRLSSIAFPFEEVGKMTARVLMDVLNHKRVNKKITFEAKLKGGETC